MPARPPRLAVAALTALLGAGSTIVLTTSSQAAAAVRANTLVASLTGTSSGDVDGSGSATIRLMARRGDVCALLSWDGIQRPSAAHIHRTSDSAVVVDLTVAVSDGSGCNTSVPTSVIRAINANPRGYYVNVHNAPYPGGAVQGTLHH